MTFWFQNFSVLKLVPIFGRFRFWRIWSWKKVLVSGNLVSDKKSWIRFRKIWSRIKSLGFGKFGIRKKVSVSVLVKILVSSFSGYRVSFFTGPALKVLSK